jgi:hypothetical protein
VKQTSLALISEDWLVGPLAQYLAQGEKIIRICCWPLGTVPTGSACADAAGGFVEGCWANACGPAARASATAASMLTWLVFAAEVIRFIMRSRPLVQTCELQRKGVRIAAHACCRYSRFRDSDPMSAVSACFI